MADKTFTVVYRVGGTENCTWERALPVADKAAAKTQAAAIERQGYKAIVNPTRYWDSIGLPEGWEYKPTVSP